MIVNRKVPITKLNGTKKWCTLQEILLIVIIKVITCRYQMPQGIFMFPSFTFKYYGFLLAF